MAATIEERVATLEANSLEQRADIKGIRDDLGEIRKDLAGRPSWPVAFALTFLSSTTVGAVSLLLAGVAR